MLKGTALRLLFCSAIPGWCVVARMGRKGEKLEALDGKTYELTEDMCVIADDSGFESVGGGASSLSPQRSARLMHCAHQPAASERSVS